MDNNFHILIERFVRAKVKWLIVCLAIVLLLSFLRLPSSHNELYSTRMARLMVASSSAGMIKKDPCRIADVKSYCEKSGFNAIVDPYPKVRYFITAQSNSLYRLSISKDCNAGLKMWIMMPPNKKDKNFVFAFDVGEVYSISSDAVGLLERDSCVNIIYNASENEWRLSKIETEAN